MKVIALLAICFLQLAWGGYITFNFLGRANKLYVPNTYDPNGSNRYPLFVMLHGCTQDPDTFSRGTKMNTYGEEENIIVLYPLQPSSSNLNKCWNWFDPNHQRRGAGEPQIIAQITQEVKRLYRINDDQVIVAGLSAGAAMTVIMGATYPDIFSGLGVAAGLEFKAALSTLAAFTAMIQGGPAPATQAALAWNSMRNFHKNPLKVLVVHGSSDFTVYPVNGGQVRDQWIGTINFALTGEKIPFTPTKTVDGQVTGGYVFKDTYFGVGDQTYVRHIAVTGMGHAWSGGSNTGSYADPRGPDMSKELISWFLASSSAISANSDA